MAGYDQGDEARTAKQAWQALAGNVERLVAGIAEANNSVIGRIHRNANGFHNPKNSITRIMLDRGGLGPHLPWTP